jgi:hypothetical protein
MTKAATHWQKLTQEYKRLSYTKNGGPLKIISKGRLQYGGNY